VLAAPRIVEAKDEFDTFIEIVEGREHVITAIEFLSPSNKSSLETQERWRQKRRDYLRGGISVVEIDLVRGAWALPGRESIPTPLPANRVIHGACITRSWKRRQHELYDLPLREPLPTLPIPLRVEDQDALLDLQSLLNQCYAKGRYAESISYLLAPEPALPAEELAWAMELLRALGVV
jgi:hypothetical protein